MKKIDIAVIGGSGLYQLTDLQQVERLRIETPYGLPSDEIVVGEMNGVHIAFLARHGQGHQFLPSEVPYRANIYALKSLGVKYIFSISAVGSLQAKLKPLDLVIPDQFIDLTKYRNNTFFGEGAVAHVSMANPVCPVLAGILSTACAQVLPEHNCHSQATYICIEGPQFSSRAESNWYRQMADIVGMTNMPEAKLAREASIAYATLALVTDFDCWHPHEQDVSADYAIQNLKLNVTNAAKVIQQAVALLAIQQPASIAHQALAAALVTPIEQMSDETYKRLKAILPIS